MTQPTTHKRFRDLMREALKDKPLGLSQAELATITGAYQSQVSRALQGMREEASTREVRIVRWARAKADCGPPVAFYALGTEADAPCAIPKLDGKERARKHREKERLRRELVLDDEGWPIRVSSQVIPPQHPIVRALYGMGAPA